MSHRTALYIKLVPHVRKLSLCLDRLYSGLFKDCYTCAVVSAVFQLFQTLHQHVSTVALTYITYYSAHKIVPPYDVLYVVIFGFSPVYDFPIDDYNTSSGKIQY